MVAACQYSLIYICVASLAQLNLRTGLARPYQCFLRGPFYHDIGIQKKTKAEQGQNIVHNPIKG